MDKVEIPQVKKPSWQPSPKAPVPRTTTDNLGRVTKQVENFTNGTVTDTSNKTTEFTYNAVGRTTVKVVLPPCGQQVIKWASRPTCLPPVRDLPNRIVGP